MELKLTIGVTPELSEILSGIAAGLGVSVTAPAKKAAASNGAAAKKPAAVSTAPDTDTEESETEDSSEVTLADIRKLMGEKADSGKKKQCIEVLKKNGSSNLSELDEAKYAKVYQAIKSL